MLNVDICIIYGLTNEFNLEEEMATHSIILAWKFPLTEELGGLQSIVAESDTTEATEHVCTH